MSWVGRAREVVLTAIASSASLVVCAVVLEVGLRIHKGALFRFGDLRATDVFGSETPAQHDSLLGYVLRPGVHEIGDQSATVDDASLRVTPLPESARGRPILVVGDSFTFGAEVRDHETWPAYLAGLLERPVVNGGVPGYGIDQAILRAEQLLPRVAFEFVVVTYISGDVDRAEYAYLYSWKPYFQTEGGRLELRNVPVPEVDYKGSLSWRIAGRSAAMQAVLRRAVPDWWYFKQPRIHREGEVVARLLLERLGRQASMADASVVVMALRGRQPDTSRVAAINRHASELGLPVLDLATDFSKRLEANPEDAGWLFQHGGHLSPAANRIVAESLATFLMRISSRE
jgi:hypothetical protein